VVVGSEVIVSLSRLSSKFSAVHRDYHVKLTWKLKAQN